MTTPTAAEVEALKVVASHAAEVASDALKAHELAFDVWSGARDAYIAARTAFREYTS